MVLGSYLLRCSRALSSRASSTLRPIAIAYDLETTSAWPATAEVVQMAFTNVAAPEEHFAAYVMPKGGIQAESSRIHGLTKATLKRKRAVSFAEAWDRAKAWIEAVRGSEGRAVVLAAHNGHRFDHPILLRQIADCESPDDPTAGATFFDTLPLAREAFPDRRGVGSHTLGRLYADASGGAPLGDAHDALADARAVAKVWPWLVGQRGADWDDYLSRVVADPTSATGACADQLRDAASSTTTTAKATKKPAAKRRASPRKAAAPPPPPEALESLPGVGPYLANALRRKEIADRFALEDFYRDQCHGSADEVFSKFCAMFPFVNKVALRKVAKSLAATPPLKASLSADAGSDDAASASASA